ncbi:hypothetical protein BDZ94DRAFT_140133 [Collybia nuda]|uniref:Uncharacterized protein n=1 Tax=Collybia nuda TaxID=64659 RepID=A0A9P6CNB7_9AGAR|nr:hypothetical protein BDZ94DRAFT_140133 [Collybia nuda]
MVEFEILPLNNMGSATFPWDQLKAESLRSVCRDVGIQGRTRDVMINFLKSVEMHGLDDALRLHSEETHTSAKPATTATSPAFLTPKRSREPVISDYNTRHRDKRVRLSDPGPGASRKRVRVSKKIETKQPQTSVAAPSRSLGGLKSAMKKKTPAKPVRREIFDGVLLRKLSLALDKNTLEDDQGDDSASGRDNDKMGDEFSGIAPSVPDETLNGEENGLPSRGESSLADSNKENELIFTSSTEDEAEQQEHDELSNTEGTSQPTHRGRYVPTTIRDRLLMSFRSPRHSNSDNRVV